MTTHRFRQITWNIPEELYNRFVALHRWSMEKNFLNVPRSEQDFALLMLDDAVSRGENVQIAYEESKDPKLIIDPFAKRGPKHTAETVKTGAHLIGE